MLVVCGEGTLESLDLFCFLQGRPSVVLVPPQPQHQVSRLAPPCQGLTHVS